MHSNTVTGSRQSHVVQKCRPTRNGQSSSLDANEAPYRQGWAPSEGLYWCAVGGEGGKAALARPKVHFAHAKNLTSAPRECLSENQYKECNTRPGTGFSVRNCTGSRAMNVENVYRSYKAAVDNGAKEVMWNPMGKLDQKFFVPATWRQRQTKLNRRGARKIAIGIEAILIAQDAFAPIYYVLNKALGNGRVHSRWASTTTGAMATANIKSFDDSRVQQGVVGGLIPSLSRLLTHLSALTGASIGHLANSMNGKNDAVAYALWGVSASVYVGWAITQCSIGVNFFLKSAIAFQLGTALIILTTVFLLAVRWAALRYDRALARPTGIWPEIASLS